MYQVIFHINIRISFFFNVFLISGLNMNLNKHYFYFTQQGVCVSVLDALTKLTFGCILKRRCWSACSRRC